MADEFLVSWVCLNPMNYHFIICIFRWHHHLGDGYPIFRQTNSSHFTTEMIQLQILFCQKWTAWFSGSGHQIASVPLFPFARATGATNSVIPKAKNPKKGVISPVHEFCENGVKVTQLLPSVPCWNPKNTNSAMFPASVLGFPLKLANYSFRKVVWVPQKNQSMTNCNSRTSKYAKLGEPRTPKKWDRQTCCLLSTWCSNFGSDPLIHPAITLTLLVVS